MKLETISEKEYRNFWEKSDQKCFLSSPEFGTIRTYNKWKREFLAVKDGKKILACTMLLNKTKRFNKKEYCALRGLLVDYSNEKLVTFFVKELKKYIKNNNGYILTIDPYILNIQRDIDGNPVENGINNQNVNKLLKKLNFKKRKQSEQVSWMFSLDVEGKDEQTLLKEMKPNTKRHVQKSMKNGINIRKLEYEELDKFYNIMIETGARKNFAIRNLEYYQNIYKLLNNRKEVVFLVTELNLKEYLTKLEDEKAHLEQLKNGTNNNDKIKNLSNDIEIIDNKIKEAKNIIKEEKKDIITLSGSMFILIKPEVIYLTSGNYEKFMNFNSQYLIQWEMIKYALNNGFKKYNFYGIPENINTHPKDYGIYEFKKGFNGYVEELIGQYELPISKEYYLNKIINFLKK